VALKETLALTLLGVLWVREVVFGESLLNLLLFEPLLLILLLLLLAEEALPLNGLVPLGPSAAFMDVFGTQSRILHMGVFAD